MTLITSAEKAFEQKEEYFWTPSCMGRPIPNVKWRILTDGHWFYIECKHIDAEQWEGGLSGTKEWLGITEEEAQKAYKKKK